MAGKRRPTANNLRKLQTARQLLGKDAGEEEIIDRLTDAWNAFVEGRASREDAEVILTDLASESEFFYIAPPDATGDHLKYREGKRALYGRILFLLDRPTSFMEAVRRAALDELQLAQQTEV